MARCVERGWTLTNNQQPVRFGLSSCKRRIVHGMREEDHLNFLTTGCQKNKTKQQVKEYKKKID